MVKKLNESIADVSDVTIKKPVVNPLDALAAEAAGVENQGVREAEKQAQKQEKQEVDTLADDLAGALNMAAMMAQPAIWWLSREQFDGLWGKSVQRAIAESGAEIMRRHGLTMGDMMSKYGPYVALAGALGPSALATVAAFKREKQRMIEAQKGGADASNKAG